MTVQVLQRGVRRGQSTRITKKVGLIENFIVQQALVIDLEMVEVVDLN